MIIVNPGLFFHIDLYLKISSLTIQRGKIKVQVTTRDKRMIDILAKATSVKEASIKSGVAQSTFYNWSARHRKRQLESRTYVNIMLNYRRKNHLLEKILKPKKRIPHVEDEEEEAEDQ
jgi:hypothetical protein